MEILSSRLPGFPIVRGSLMLPSLKVVSEKRAQPLDPPGIFEIPKLASCKGLRVSGIFEMPIFFRTYFLAHLTYPQSCFENSSSFGNSKSISETRNYLLLTNFGISEIPAHITRARGQRGGRAGSMDAPGSLSGTIRRALLPGGLTLTMAQSTPGLALRAVLGYPRVNAGAWARCKAMGSLGLRRMTPCMLSTLGLKSE